MDLRLCVDVEVECVVKLDFFFLELRMLTENLLAVKWLPGRAPLQV